MESGGGTIGSGRYADKGGQQVGCFFNESADNERIKGIYGNYNFWSWLRYWYLDTENHIMLMLLDKGYYDYDYEVPDAKTQAALTAVKSDDELLSKLKNMGFGVAPKKIEPKPKDLSKDDAQRIMMQELKAEKQKNKDD